MRGVFAKKNLKFFLPAVILAFVASFMLFIYEPIVMYSGNITDFWFDLPLLMQLTLILAITTFVILAFIFFVIWLICITTKKTDYYNRFLIIAFVVFFFFYIHGNFLAGFLPILDGEPIDWGGFIIPNILSVVLFIISIVSIIIILTKKKESNFVKYFSYVTAAIFVLLGVSVLSAIFTTNGILDKKDVVAYPTNKNLTTLSTEKNFLILTLDATDSTTFSNILKNNPKYKNMLKDFTYFPDTLSSYPYSMEEIPMILTGEKYGPTGGDFQKFSTNALNNSKLFNKLKINEYDINLYLWNSDLIWHDRQALEISNLSIGNKTNKTVFLKQELKYILFKYLPFQLKKYSKIESFDFNLAQIPDSEYGIFNCENKAVYDYLSNNAAVLMDKNYFQYMHIHGSHPPFDSDENFNEIFDGTYEQKMLSALKVAELYIQRLKDNNLYNNSTIILMADHGYKDNAAPGRQNPILYIKGMGDTHDETQVSDTAVSHEDLVTAFIDLIDQKPVSELFKGTANKKRLHIMYDFYERTGVEYELTGKAWDANSLIPTGNQYEM